MEQAVEKHGSLCAAIDALGDGDRTLTAYEVTESADEESDSVLLDVADPGEPLRVSQAVDRLAPEIEAQLFQPFATYGKPHGTGLGLSICKRIIEDHRGHIHARSEPGRGAVFSFRLPRTDVPADAKS